jgi:hypothetical protein
MIIKSSEEGVQRTLYNKIGGFLRIQISRSLIFKDIIIDSLDSILSDNYEYYDSTGTKQ